VFRLLTTPHVANYFKHSTRTARGIKFSLAVCNARNTKPVVVNPAVFTFPYLTVPSPRGEELDEHRLSGSFGVPIVWCEFDGVGAGHKAEQDQSEILHGCCVDDFNFLCQQCGAMQRCPVFGHFILVVCPSVQYRHFQYKLVLVFTYARLSTRLNGGTISVPAKLKQRGTSVVVSHRCRASTHWSACNLIQFVLAVHLMKETI